MSEPRDLTPEEEARIVEFVDGTLTGEALEEFERQLAGDARLVAALEAFEEMEELAREHAVARTAEEVAPRAAPGTLLRGPWRVWAAAAAVALVGTLALRELLTAPDSGAGTLALAVLDTRADAADLNERLLLERDWLPASLATSRGGLPSPDAPSAAEYAAALADALVRETERALAEGSAVASSARFVVGLRAPREASVLLLSVREDGSLARLFPRRDVELLDEGREARDLVRSRLPAGRLVVLPAPLAERTAPGDPDGPLRFDPGFVGSPRSAPRLVVALRSAPLDASFLAELEARLALPRAELEAWLASSGFDLNARE